MGRAEGGLRFLALAGVLGAVAGALGGRSAEGPCRTDVGACAQEGAPACDRTLGPWRVVRSRTSGLPEARSHSACVLAGPGDAPPAVADAAGRDTGPVVAIVPQERGVSGDTLLSRAAAPRAERARATVILRSMGSLPDHWVFALAGDFLDVGARTRCGALDVVPPVNAGYALIGSNWAARPHGFYFERLADACVYDGTRAACDGEAPSIAHEFAPGEIFALDLALRRDAEREDRWWLEAEVALLEDGGARRRDLGHMRRAVAEPCWLADRDPLRALVLVIPDHEAPRTAPETRVEVRELAWLE